VRIPGDGAIIGREARKAGELEISANIWERISALADGST
jgi:hypothetical protein